MLEIDGSFGEAGGQILRTATSLSAITGKACRIFNIRKGRKEPGLMTQHLIGVQNMARLCNGFLEGDYLGSTEIKFYPKGIVPQSLRIKIPTAGSIILLLQSLLPVAIFASGSTKISFEGGGSDVPFSPTSDYFRFIFLKVLEKINVKASLEILKRGYYPEGGARAEAKIFPSKIRKLALSKRGKLQRILVLSGASDSLKERKVVERQIFGVKEILGKLQLPVEEKTEYCSTECPGSQICLVAEFENTVLGVDNLGKLGKRAEDVGKETALELLKEEKSGTCLDKYLADQILLYMALSNNKAQATGSEITNHCRTNVWVIEKFFEGKFRIDGNSISWSPTR